MAARRVATAALLASLLFGCFPDTNGDGQKIGAVFGDSNDARCWFYPPGDCTDRWPELVNAENPGYILHNFARQGATMCRRDGHIDVLEQLDKALRAGIRFDVGILSGKINDFYFFTDATPEEVAACTFEIAEILRQNGMIPVIALAQPVDASFPELNERVLELNRLLVARSPVAIDFWTGFWSDTFIEDGIHLNQRGEQERADVVLSFFDPERAD